MTGGIGVTTPLRMNQTQHSVYGNDKSPEQFPQGPPMTDMTNVHPGSIIVQGGQKVSAGPMKADDEKEMVQVLYEIILNEAEVEAAKQKLAE